MDGSDKTNEIGFAYYELHSALQSYKAMLLGLYRSKKVKSFSICLNRFGDAKWTNAIVKETTEDD
jgi:hypothetical protein